jgi:hypothetical protein
MGQSSILDNPAPVFNSKISWPSFAFPSAYEVQLDLLSDR